MRQLAPRQISSFQVFGLLALTLLLALGLRLWFVRQVNPFVDEYISTLAFRAIVQYRVPRLPSGMMYAPKGLLHSYIGALALLGLGSSNLALRFPSVIAGMLTICCLYRAGRDWFSPAVGLWAAAALASLPSAIEWSGRARMYALFQMFLTAAIYLLIKGYQKNVSLSARILGVFAMLLALLSHTLALIALCSVVIGWAASRWALPKERRTVQAPSHWEVLAWVILCVAILVLQPAKGAWGFGGRLSEIAQGKMSVQNLRERAIYVLAFAQPFFAPPLWPLTILYIVGLINLIKRNLNKAFFDGDGVAWTLYGLSLCTWLGTAALSKLYDERYLFGILPIYVLLACREAQLMFRAISAAVKPEWGGLVPRLLSVMVWLAILAAPVPSTKQLVQAEHTDFVPAFAHVRESWHQGDVIATAAPAVSFLTLGRVDYYVIQRGPESYKDACILTGAPLIDSTQELAAVLASHPRVWLVLEEQSWEGHFDQAFRQFIQQKMELVFHQNEMLVFVH